MTTTIKENRVGIRMDSELKEKLERLAEKEHRTLSGYCYMILKSVAEQETMSDYLSNLESGDKDEQVVSIPIRRKDLVGMLIHRKGD